jgi:hypothetical protein
MSRGEAEWQNWSRDHQICSSRKNEIVTVLRILLFITDLQQPGWVSCDYFIWCKQSRILSRNYPIKFKNVCLEKFLYDFMKEVRKVNMFGDFSHLCKLLLLNWSKIIKRSIDLECINLSKTNVKSFVLLKLFAFCLQFWNIEYILQLPWLLGRLELYERFCFLRSEFGISY